MVSTEERSFLMRLNHELLIAPKVQYSQSGGLVAWLAQLSVSLAVSSYQSGFFVLARA